MTSIQDSRLYHRNPNSWKNKELDEFKIRTFTSDYLEVRHKWTTETGFIFKPKRRTIVLANSISEINKDSQIIYFPRFREMVKNWIVVENTLPHS